MLRYLHIRNIAVIEEVEVEFGPGLNVVTGETGSGKSILMDSLGLLLGNRASGDLVRTGQTRAVVEAQFELEPNHPARQWLAGLGVDLEPDDPVLLLRREVSTTGPGRAQINGQMVPWASLRELGPMLVEIHGQHDGRLMLQPRYHLELLDRFHGQAGLLDEVAGLARRLTAGRAERDALAEAARDRAHRLELLDFQIGEIEQAAPRPGEEESLAAERAVLVHAERLLSVAGDAYHRLYEAEDAVLQTLSQLHSALSRLIEVDPRLSGAVETLQACQFQAEDVAFFLREYAAGVEFQPARLDEVESRLALLDRLKRRFALSTCAELEPLRMRLTAERESLAGSDRRLEELATEQATLTAQYGEAAGRLGAVRRQAATAVEAHMSAQLADLAMPGTRFTVELTPQIGDDCPETGRETAEFLVSPNVGEALRPLRKAASGGELSRLTLAVKLILHGEPGLTLVFDEVDAGIGGGTAEVVGRKLRAVAAANQSFCITHVPQIAALADRHYRVDKEVLDGRTRTRVTPLSADERIEELARMLGGLAITDVTRQHARELLAAR